MNTSKDQKADAVQVGELLDWRPMNEVSQMEEGALISQLREEGWDKKRATDAARYYRSCINPRAQLKAVQA
jgi:hypothetical protein